MSSDFFISALLVWSNCLELFLLSLGAILKQMSSDFPISALLVWSNCLELYSLSPVKEEFISFIILLIIFYDIL